MILIINDYKVIILLCAFGFSLYNPTLLKADDEPLEARAPAESPILQGYRQAFAGYKRNLDPQMNLFGVPSATSLSISSGLPTTPHGLSDQLHSIITGPHASLYPPQLLKANLLPQSMINPSFMTTSITIPFVTPALRQFQNAEDRAVCYEKTVGGAKMISGLNVLQKSFQAISEKGLLVATKEQASELGTPLKQAATLIMKEASVTAPKQMLKALPKITQAALAATWVVGSTIAGTMGKGEDIAHLLGNGANFFDSESTSHQKPPVAETVRSAADNVRTTAQIVDDVKKITSPTKAGATAIVGTSHALKSAITRVKESATVIKSQDKRLKAADAVTPSPKDSSRDTSEPSTNFEMFDYISP